ncbi:MAG: CBS domain-containing protein, partial [Bdellovibrionales bacterium]|nr:CBS domain-containing protein [Bdellovibrionales bacterium]
KCERCLIYPPHINEFATYPQVARYMVTSKLYTLPVFDEQQQVIGIIESQSLLEAILHDEHLCDQVMQRLMAHQPITLSETSSVQQAYDLIKKRQISRVLLVDSKEKLTGIVSRKDLLSRLRLTETKDRYTQHQHLDFHYGSFFDEQDQNAADIPVKQIATVDVCTIRKGAPLCQALETMLRKHTQSVVFVDSEHKPTAFVSRYDFLRALASLDDSCQIPILLERGRGMNKGHTISGLISEVEWFANKWNQYHPLRRVEVKISRKNGLYKTQIRLVSNAKRGQLGVGQGKTLRVSADQAIQLLDQKLPYQTADIRSL